MTEASDAWTGKPISNQQRKSLRFVSLPELCEILDVSPKSVRDMLISPSFPFHQKGRPGQSHVFDTAAVINWLKDREKGRGGSQTKIRLDELRIEREELRNRAARGNLVDADEFGPFIEGKMVEVRQFLVTDVVRSIKEKFGAELANAVREENSKALNLYSGVNAEIERVKRNAKGR